MHTGADLGSDLRRANGWLGVRYSRRHETPPSRLWCRHSGIRDDYRRRTTTLRLPLDRSHPHTSVRTAYRFGGESSHIADPFAENPVRRSATVVAACVATLTVPFQISDELGMAVILTVGIFAISGLIFVTPILIWSLIEAAVLALRRRVYPDVDQLDLSPRVVHILRRHGMSSVRDVERSSDAVLLSFSNLEVADVRALRRAIRLWHYRRWQERGFPATGVGSRE
jgi:hypothetical protein